ncbi:MAG: hypothetical protein QW412_00295 [Candidatus Aenigmatarchaeota archaeon]
MSRYEADADSYKTYEEFYKNLPVELRRRVESLSKQQAERLKGMLNRYFSDYFYRITIKTAFLSLESVNETAKRLGAVPLICGIRGSVIRGNINYKDDIDIVFIGTKRKSVMRETRRILINYSRNIKREFPQVERVDVIYLYSPRTPKNPYEQEELFLTDITEFDFRTTQADEIIDKKIFRYFKKLRKEVPSILEDIESDWIEKSENIRDGWSREFGIPHHLAHGATALLDLRLSGFTFSRKRMNKANIINVRDALFLRLFGHLIPSTKSFFNIFNTEEKVS